MLRSILIYGALAGLILLPFGLITAMTGPPAQYGMAIGYTVMLIALSMVFLGVKKRRDTVGGGVIGFWPAFGFGLAISATAGIFYVLAWEFSPAVTGVDFIGDYARMVIADMKAAGASPDKIAKAAADMEKMRVDYANPLFRMPITFTEIAPVGLLVSLVSAGLLRNPRFLPAGGQG